MDLEEALEHAAIGDGILFLWAGFSAGATNTKDQPFRTGTALVALYLNRDWKESGGSCRHGLLQR